MLILVPSSGPTFSEALNLHLFGLDSLQENSESIKQESTQRVNREQSDCVILLEPKILHLV